MLTLNCYNPVRNKYIRPFSLHLRPNRTAIVLQLFRKNRIQNYFFVLIYVILLRLFTFFMDFGPVTEGGIVYEIFGLTFAEDHNGYRILSILVIFYHVILINRLAEFNNLTYANTLIPGIWYALMLSIVPEIHPLSPVLMGNTFILIAITQLFQSIHRNQRSKRVFNTGFYVTLAALFDLSFLYFIPFFIIAANAIILVRVRDVILYTLGVVAPLYFLSAYWVITDQFFSGIQLVGQKFQLFKYDFIYQNYGIIKVMLFSLLVFFLLIVLNKVVTRTNIFVRNKLTFLFYFMVMAAVAFSFSFHIQLNELQMVILPVGMLMGLYIVGIKRVQIAESIHFLLLIIAVLFQYFLK